MVMTTEDIEPEEYNNEALKEYEERANNMVLKAGRVIITYETPEEKAFLEELLCEKKDCLKVIYKCKDIISSIEGK